MATGGWDLHDRDWFRLLLTERGKKREREEGMWGGSHDLKASIWMVVSRCSEVSGRCSTEARLRFRAALGTAVGVSRAGPSVRERESTPRRRETES